MVKKLALGLATTLILCLDVFSVVTFGQPQPDCEQQFFSQPRRQLENQQLYELLNIDLSDDLISVAGIRLVNGEINDDGCLYFEVEMVSTNQTTYGIRYYSANGTVSGITQTQIRLSQSPRSMLTALETRIDRVLLYPNSHVGIQLNKWGFEGSADTYVLRFTDWVQSLRLVFDQGLFSEDPNLDLIAATQTMASIAADQTDSPELLALSLAINGIRSGTESDPQLLAESVFDWAKLILTNEAVRQQLGGVLSENLARTLALADFYADYLEIHPIWVDAITKPDAVSFDIDYAGVQPTPEQEGIFSAKIEQFGPLGICTETGYDVYGFEPLGYFETPDTFIDGISVDELLIVATTPEGVELDSAIVHFYQPSDGVSLSSGRVRGIDWNLSLPVIFDLYDGSSGQGFNRERSLARRIISCGLVTLRQPSASEIPDLIVEASNNVGANADWQPAASLLSEGSLQSEMVLVPVGCFEMGSSDEDIQTALAQCNAEIGNCQLDWFQKETPTASLCIENPFWMDRFEVTNQQYGSVGQFAGETYPRDSVSWHDAQSHCQRRGATLPTEAQWEYAARGPNNLRYPWGTEFIAEYAAHNGNSNSSRPVGSYLRGASWVGALDLSGNLREWTTSIFADNNYPYIASDGREDLNAPGNRVVRGGSWLTVPVSTRTTDRVGVDPSTRDWNIGFRCIQEVSLR